MRGRSVPPKVDSRLKFRIYGAEWFYPLASATNGYNYAEL